jgi:DNA polymerase-3 subunit epsilon
MRQVVLDTETTGLEAGKGHRIIEIGCVELMERRRTGREFQRRINPQRAIDEGARAVSGISDESLLDQPLFAQIAGELLEFIAGAELVIHNAEFDVGFLDAELARLAAPTRIAEHCTVLDTLALAREKYPGQKNSLDALCRRLNVDNSHRVLHGALLDAQLLTEVYLAMTGGQGDLGLAAAPAEIFSHGVAANIVARPPLRVRYADAEELVQHELRLTRLDSASKGRCVWQAAVREVAPAEVLSPA